MQLSGNFTNGERYRDSFKNQKEFEWVLAHIAQNGACCYPDRIYGDKAEDKLPKYVKGWLKATGAEYVKEGHSGN